MPSSSSLAEFNVDGFSEIVWNETAFGQLVLPDAYKSILWAFIQSQVNKNVKFDDIVQGKGMLLLCPSRKPSF